MEQKLLGFDSNLVFVDTCKAPVICIEGPPWQLGLRSVLASDFAQHANGSLANH